jgi:septum formation protein
MALRLAREKARTIAATGAGAGAFVLAADTVVAVGRRVLPKAETPDEARRCLELLSGRAHRVLTGVAVAAPDGRVSARLSESRLHFKRLTRAEIDRYLDGGEWRGKAGGYAIQGAAGAFVMTLQGSYTGVVGLPLYEALSLLEGLGWRRP